ncbi:uncharacterized protein LOC114305739 [Camellia sinensis]|uniref:uncharacterized protein LOC114305739 n=1 Tax=Camellia sinensis TaxID=4442 RepID=UPI0010368BA2|nr:uncharacterized protein LOC114305739 [Camellia sinensis]
MDEANLAVMKQTKAPITEWKGKRSGYKFKKGHSFVMNKKQNTGSTSSSSQSTGSTHVCSECERKHKIVYYRASSACFWCGKLGYMMKDCPLTAKNANRPMASLAGSISAPRSNIRTNAKRKPLRQGRVFALVPGDVQNTKSVVSSILPICAQNAYVLIDSSSTHSFVSHAFFRKLTRSLEPMNYLLAVPTPSGGTMMCAYVYPACDVMVGDVLIYVVLLPLDIAHFDCILGIDWLTKYCATIDCVNKSIVLRPPGLSKFVFAGNGIVLPP